MATTTPRSHDRGPMEAALDMVGSIERVLAALERAGVRYLVVGGVAVVLHGHLRTTADLDLVVQLEPANTAAAAAALAAIGLRPRAPVPLSAWADPEQRRRLVEQKGLTVFSLWSPDDPTLEVDLFASEPFDFDTAHARAVRVELDSVDVVVASLEDLIAMKAAVDRPRDREDVEALRALLDERRQERG